MNTTNTPLLYVKLIITLVVLTGSFILCYAGKINVAEMMTLDGTTLGGLLVALGVQGAGAQIAAKMSKPLSLIVLCLGLGALVGGSSGCNAAQQTTLETSGVQLGVDIAMCVLENSADWSNPAALALTCTGQNTPAAISLVTKLITEGKASMARLQAMKPGATLHMHPVRKDNEIWYEADGVGSVRVVWGNS